MELTPIQLKAKILSTGRALERADWPHMNAMAASKFCELHARMGGCHDPIALEMIICGALWFVMHGGSNGHPGEALDQEEIDAQIRRPLQYAQLDQAQRSQVAAMFMATAARQGLDQYVYDVSSDGQILSRKRIDEYLRYLER